MEKPAPEEQNTWAAFQARPCEKTFRPIYDKTEALVYTLCYRILNNEEDARDAFQSAY